ncbi:MAG: NAD-dependent protein deacylase [Defluviitaleaceae bacterium]|nr:NAD-dependent protein deacylase [Defluviitaleaceae bacterium]
MSQLESTDRLKAMIADSDYIVFFGGAGVSTESGIPDFRSQDGLYSQKYKYPPETMLSAGFFRSNAGEFFEFYRNKLIYPDVKPNKAHLKLAELERLGKLKAVVTQNIDGLHQLAGSETVLELHGSVLRNFCLKCRKSFGIETVTGSEGVPECDCGGTIKPDVVLFGEGLNPDTVESAAEHISRADMLIVGGTSLNVYPAAGLLRYYRGTRLVLINMDATPYDDRANLIIRGKIGETLGNI